MITSTVSVFLVVLQSLKIIDRPCSVIQGASSVVLHAYTSTDSISIDVEDCCGGLPEGSADTMFKPFHQRFDAKRGLGLGLSIARRSVEAE